ncbi:hypothetical protein VTH82DRAFT_8703 [Thermothelomyces myriococcoides]
MTLTVLTDDEIRSLLENLTLDDLEGFSEALASALYEYSTSVPGDGGGEGGASDTRQPERASVRHPDIGVTTLFMPSSNSAGNAVKVVTLTSASPAKAEPNQDAATTSTAQQKPPVIPPTGAIALFDRIGSPLGLLHATVLTGFRTALASLAMVRYRSAALRTIVVFGRGGQAYWHTRLALLARGRDVRRVVFVCRSRPDATPTNVTTTTASGDVNSGPEQGSSDGAGSLRSVLPAVAKQLVEGVPAEVKEREGWAECEFGVLTADEEAYATRLTELLREADAIFCCTPSTEVLFDPAALDDEKTRLVVAIGSYTPQMRELPRGLVQRALTPREGKEAGVVVVDTIEGALKEAGELIDIGAKPEQLVELGELLVPKGLGERARDTRRNSLESWLQTGNVIYKSVGLGLMDLSIGMHIIEFAKQKGIGTHIPGF